MYRSGLPPCCWQPQQWGTCRERVSTQARGSLDGAKQTHWQVGTASTGPLCCSRKSQLCYWSHHRSAAGAFHAVGPTAKSWKQKAWTLAGLLGHSGPLHFEGQLPVLPLGQGQCTQVDCHIFSGIQPCGSQHHVHYYPFCY